MGEWLRSTPIWLLGSLLLIACIASAYSGAALTRGLARLRGCVQEANAIEAVYLKAQLLGEPHRSRFSNLLIRYAENHLELAQLHRDDSSAQKLIADDNLILREIWTATVPAFQSVKTLDFSSSFVDAVTNLVQVGAERKAVRRSQIPSTILLVLIFYTLVAAAVLGGVMKASPQDSVRFPRMHDVSGRSFDPKRTFNGVRNLDPPAASSRTLDNIVFQVPTPRSGSSDIRQA